jgi:hypothetical protein
LSLKTKLVEGFPVWASKLVAQFGDLGRNITAIVSWFGPQNQVCDGLSVAPQNRREGNGVGYASRSSGLLCVKASWARVSRSDLKTGLVGCASKPTGGQRRGTHVEI